MFGFYRYSMDLFFTNTLLFLAGNITTETEFATSSILLFSFIMINLTSIIIETFYDNANYAEKSI